MMIKLHTFAATIGMAAIATTASAQTFHLDLAAFQAELVGDSYTEAFDGWGFGNPLGGDESWDAPGAHGFGWTASSPGGLYSVPGALSTNVSGDPLVFTFTGNAVTAFGGDFAGTDIDGNPIPAVVSFETNDGNTYSDTFTTFSFIGFTSSTPIVSVTIDVGTIEEWAAADNVITGVIPEPTAALGLVSGGLLLLRRRR